MTTKIAKAEFSKDQIGLISRTIAQGATKDELALFIGMCKRTGLDPFQRMIYFIKDKSGRVMTQISVDGFRIIAARSGDYAGQDAPVFEEDEDGKIIKCTVTAYRWHGETRYPAGVGVAYWKEYSRPSQTWDKMPHTMIAKVAECVALRKAFPNDLSGLYAAEEIVEGMMEPAIEVEAEVVKKKAELAKLMSPAAKPEETKIEPPIEPALSPEQESEIE